MVSQEKGELKIQKCLNEANLKDGKVNIGYREEI